MSSDEEDVAIPILWFLLREIEQEENKKKNLGSSFELETN